MKEVIVSKTELQNLRTLKNMHIKCLKQIRYLVEHCNKSGDYDGFYADECFEDILTVLDSHDDDVDRMFKPKIDLNEIGETWNNGEFYKR